MTLKILILTCFKPNILKIFEINHGEGGIQTEPKRVDMDWYESIEIKNKDISPTISPTNVLFVN